MDRIIKNSRIKGNQAIVTQNFPTRRNTEKKKLGRNIRTQYVTQKFNEAAKN